MAQKDIQSVLQEDRVFPPSAQFRKHATLKGAELEALYVKTQEKTSKRANKKSAVAANRSTRKVAAKPRRGSVMPSRRKARGKK